MPSSPTPRPHHRLPVTHQLARGTLAALTLAVFLAIAYTAVRTGIAAAIVDGGRNFAGWARDLWNDA